MVMIEDQAFLAYWRWVCIPGFSSVAVEILFIIPVCRFSLSGGDTRETGVSHKLGEEVSSNWNITVYIVPQ